MSFKELCINIGMKFAIIFFTIVNLKFDISSSNRYILMIIHSYKGLILCYSLRIQTIDYHTKTR